MKCLFAKALVFVIFASVASGQQKVRRFRGEALDEGVIRSQHLENQRILVTDFMSEINNNFTKEELKRGLRGPYYIRFNLRDSKLRCLVSKYDAKNAKRLSDIRKNDRITIIGRIEQIAFGIKKFSNPYYIFRVSHVESGWLLDEGQRIFSPFPQEAVFEDVAPHDLSARPDEYAGEFVRVHDRFSMPSTFFSTLERDLNLDNRNSLKFYLENCNSPCYMPNTEENRTLLASLRSGMPVVVCGRLNLCPFEDDALMLFSVKSIERTR